MAPTDGFDEETTLGDILSAGPQPTIEKGVTKSPTRKALQQAAQRKEAALRRVLAAQTRRGYVADHLVHPVCHGVLRRQDSTGEQLRLALEIIKRANCPPESERALADAIRAGLATRLDQSPTGDDDRAAPDGEARGAPSASRARPAPPRRGHPVGRQAQAHGLHRQGLAHARRQPRVKGGGHRGGGSMPLAAALNSINASAPAGADATGACGEGALLARAVWRTRSSASSPGRAARGGGIDPRWRRRLSTRARCCSVPRWTDATRRSHGLRRARPDGERLWRVQRDRGRGRRRGRVRAKRERGRGRRGGIATSADGDDPRGVSCPLLATLRLEAACHLVSRAAGVAERANGLPLEMWAVAVGRAHLGDVRGAGASAAKGEG